MFLKDPEATVYAIEAATCLTASVGSGNWLQACLDGVSLIGWTLNATTLGES